MHLEQISLYLSKINEVKIRVLIGDILVHLVLINTLQKDIFQGLIKSRYIGSNRTKFFLLVS